MLVSKISEYENHLYHRVLHLLYVVSLLKCQLFNPDPILRVKLIWSLHMKEGKNKKYYKDCFCIYGLDNATIGELKMHKTTRKELIEIQIKVL